MEDNYDDQATPLRMEDESDTASLMPELVEANFKDKVFKPLKGYFMVTGQYRSPENDTRAKRILYALWQLLIFCLAATYFLYTLAIWGGPEQKKVYDIAHYFYFFPLTVIEWTMWEFRWWLTCILGIVFSRSIWMELCDKSIHLRDDGWKKVKLFSIALFAALALMWSLSVLGSLSEIDFQITQKNALTVFLDALFMLIDRLIAFPLFFLFCFTMYILCCMVEQYRDDIEKWPTTTSEREDDQVHSTDSAGQDFAENSSSEKYKENSTSEEFEENPARERFREIKEAIRRAGLSFEFYIMAHFLLLMCTVFLGVCACFEQMEVQTADNSTLLLPFQIPHYSRYINFVGNFTPPEIPRPAASIMMSAASVTAASHVQMPQHQGKHSLTGVNGTLGNPIDDVLETKLLKYTMRMMAICTSIKTLESLLLYIVPVALMVSLQNRLRRVYEVIEDCNWKKQRKKELLFKNANVVRRMCKYVKTAHGLRIYGYTVPTFTAFILAAFGPFFAVVIQRVLMHVHMKR